MNPLVTGAEGPPRERAIATPAASTLRERRLLATRDAISSAARELFSTLGYEATTVAAIAERGGVSLRTFYRYFPTKESAALDHLERFVNDGVDLISGRPHDEHPVDSILFALEELSKRNYVESLALDYLLVETVAEVGGLQHHIVMRSQDQLTDVFALRMGQTKHSIEARLFATAITAAYQAATRTWMRRINDGEVNVDVWDLARRSVLMLTEAIPVER